MNRKPQLIGFLFLLASLLPASAAKIGDLSETDLATQALRFFTLSSGLGPFGLLDQSLEQRFVVRGQPSQFNVRNTTRRFCCRPSSVSLLAMGSVSP